MSSPQVVVLLDQCIATFSPDYPSQSPAPHRHDAPGPHFGSLRWHLPSFPTSILNWRPNTGPGKASSALNRRQENNPPRSAGHAAPNTAEVRVCLVCHESMLSAHLHRGTGYDRKFIPALLLNPSLPDWSDAWGYLAPDAELCISEISQSFCSPTPFIMSPDGSGTFLTTGC